MMPSPLYWRPVGTSSNTREIVDFGLWRLRPVSLEGDRAALRATRYVWPGDEQREPCLCIVAPHGRRATECVADVSLDHGAAAGERAVGSLDMALELCGN